MITLSGVQKYIIDAADDGLCFEAIAAQLKYKFGRNTNAARCRASYIALKSAITRENEAIILAKALLTKEQRLKLGRSDFKPFKPNKPVKPTRREKEWIDSRLVKTNDRCNHISGYMAGSPVYCQHDAEHNGYCERHALMVAAE